MTARITAVVAGAMLLFLGLMATAWPGHLVSDQGVGRGVSFVVMSGGPTAGAVPNAAGVTSKNGAWARLLMIGFGLLSLGLIVRKRLRNDAGTTEKA